VLRVVVFDLEAAVDVSRPAHVLVLLLKTAVEAEVKAAVEAEIQVEVEVESPSIDHNYAICCCYLLLCERRKVWPIPLPAG
jgi:hypothetical protein